LNGTETLGNDPRWAAGMRNIASTVIGGAPPTATFARCTVSGAQQGVNCLIEYFPNIGRVETGQQLYQAAVNLVEIWYDHNPNFPGLTFTLAKQPDGDWQIEINFASAELAQAAASAPPPPPAQQAPAANADWGQLENAFDTGGHPGGSYPGDEEWQQNQEYQQQQQDDGSYQDGGSGDEDGEPAPRRSRQSARTAMIHDGRGGENGQPRWMKPAIFGAIGLVVVGIIGGGVAFFLANSKPPEPPKTFAQERRAFETNLTKRAESPQEFDEDAPEGVKEVEYSSGERQLKAWLILPDREPPFPAVVFAHDGFALRRTDYDAARPFVDHGFAVLLPSWRGENGNPGDFEMCYGEVDDLVAAIDYMSTRKKVDKDSVFAAGYGVGATNVMLACEITDRLRKAAACAGRPDMFEAGEAYESAPFNQRDHKERMMRSPQHFLDDLKCPMILLYGDKDPSDKFFLEQARKMEKTSKKQPILVEELPGTTHQTSLAPAIARMITFFNSR